MAWGPWQLLIVLAIILILFGGKKLPDLAHSLGKSLGEFKKGKEEGDRVEAPAPKPQVEQQAAPAAATAAPAQKPEVVTPEVVA